MAMNSTALGVGDQVQLDNIFKMAYGTGSGEGAKGGKGNIGLWNGRVIKFNTHWTERMGSASENELKASNELRLKLAELSCRILEGMQSGEGGARAEALRGVMDSIRRELGIVNQDGTDVVSESAGKKLLDRSIVARIVRQVKEGEGKSESLNDLASKLDDRRAEYTSMRHADFTAVTSRLEAGEGGAPSVANVRKAEQWLKIGSLFAEEIRAGEQKGAQAGVTFAADVTQMACLQVRRYLLCHPGVVDRIVSLGDRDDPALRQSLRDLLATSVAQEYENQIIAREVVSESVSTLLSPKGWKPFYKLLKAGVNVSYAEEASEASYSPRIDEKIKAALFNKIIDCISKKAQENGLAWHTMSADEMRDYATKELGKFADHVKGLQSLALRQPNTSVGYALASIIRRDPMVKGQVLMRDLAVFENLPDAPAPAKDHESAKAAFIDFITLGFVALRRQGLQALEDLGVALQRIAECHAAKHGDGWKAFLKNVDVVRLANDLFEKTRDEANAETGDRMNHDIAHLAQCATSSLLGIVFKIDPVLFKQIADQHQVDASVF